MNSDINPYTAQLYTTESSFNVGEFNNFKSVVRNLFSTYYVGLAKPLKIGGELFNIWLDLQKSLIEYGKIAVVNYGGRFLLARVIKGVRNKKGEWKDLRLCWLGDEDSKEFEPLPDSYVIFFWNSNGEPFSLLNVEYDLRRIWETKQLIHWDQEKSKKMLTVQFQRTPNDEELNKVFKNIHSGYLKIISPNVTNEINDYKIYETKNSAERQQLWRDKNELWNDVCLYLGIRHNPFVKESRQNNPEIKVSQSYFDSWENERFGCLLKGLLELQSKDWGSDVEVFFQYGSLPPCYVKNSKFLNNLNEEQVQTLLLPPQESIETKEIEDNSLY